MQVDRNLFGGVLTQTANVARRLTGKSTLDEAYYQKMMQSSQEFYDGACTTGIWEAALIVPAMGGSTVTGGTAPAVVTNSGQVVSGANSATLVAAPHIVFSKNEDEGKGNSGKSQLKKIGSNSAANKAAKEVGYESAEAFKEDFVGKSNISKFNMKYDPKTREIILESIKGSTQVPTGYYLP